MTPRNLEPTSVQSKLTVMRELIEDLDTLGGLSVEQLREERLDRRALERILTQLVDLAVAVNSHVVGARTGEAPRTYAASFDLAAKADLITSDLAAELRLSVGLRNVLVHEYVETDLAILVDTTPKARNGFAQYIMQVASYLSRAADD